MLTAALESSLSKSGKLLDMDSKTIIILSFHGGMLLKFFG